MKVTLESTSKVVEMIDGDRVTQVRVWEGETDTGIKCHAYIVRIAHAEDDDEAAWRFAAELQRTRDPSPAIEAIPLRLVL